MEAVLQLGAEGERQIEILAALVGLVVPGRRTEQVVAGVAPDGDRGERDLGVIVVGPGPTGVLHLERELEGLGQILGIRMQDPKELL